MSFGRSDCLQSRERGRERLVAGLRCELMEMLTGTGKWSRFCQQRGWKVARSAALVAPWPGGRTPALRLAQSIVAGHSLAEMTRDLLSITGFGDFAAKELLCDALLMPWWPCRPADEKTTYIWSGFVFVCCVSLTMFVVAGHESKALAHHRRHMASGGAETITCAATQSATWHRSLKTSGP